jgi:hypothetical protein
VSAAATLLHQLGRPGVIRLGTAHPTRHERLLTGVVGLDAALGGGLPRGRISELVGARSSGRTGLACRIAATATALGETIAWVDPDDTLEPEAAAAAGLDLTRTLWVRPRNAGDALQAAELLVGAGGFGLVVLDLGDGGIRTAAPASARPYPRRRPSRTPSWTRVVHAAERTRSTLLVIGSSRLAGSFATLTLELGAGRACWSGNPGQLVLLDGVVARITVVRSRLGGTGRACTIRHCA